MLEFAGPLAVVALVLATGGIFKLRDPRPTRAMFVSVGLADRPLLGRMAVASGVVEVVVGVAAFLWGGRVLAGATAVAFAMFTLLAVRLVRSSAASCGCFGRLSGRTTWVHVAVDAGIAVVALAATVADAPGFIAAQPDLPAAGLPFVAFAALGAWLVVVALTALPDALLAARRTPRHATVQKFEIRAAP
jgi:hypothetical protein